jgi:hypothetical protein
MTVTISVKSSRGVRKKGRWRRFVLGGGGGGAGGVVVRRVVILLAATIKYTTKNTNGEESCINKISKKIKFLKYIRHIRRFGNFF